MKRLMGIFCLLLATSVGFSQNDTTFTNPLLPSGADPWCIYKDGYYYYTHTTGRNITIWKTRSIAQLNTAEKKVVFTPPPSGPYSKEVWAPEIHFLQNKWYIYFAADSGNNNGHRLWVLENDASDPLNGEWIMKGKLVTPDDKWSIDGSVFEYQGKGYLVWSGWEGDENGQQDIYIAAMSNPWTVQGKRAKISSPELPWEMHGDLHDKNNPPHVNVNEGPEVLVKDNKLFLIFTHSACLRHRQAAILWIRRPGKNHRSLFSNNRKKMVYMHPGITPFSHHPMEKRTGYYTMPTASPTRDAAATALPARNLLAGRKTAHPILGYQLKKVSG
jgi:GH43 family beta-xylosidase